MAEMITFTLEGAVENHRKLWREIARILEEEPDEKYLNMPNPNEKLLGGITILKEEVMNKLFPNFYSDLKTLPYTVIKNNCFLCHFADGKCITRCPLESQYAFNGCLNGLWNKFELYLYANNSFEKAAKTARKIAELPIITKEANV